MADSIGIYQRPRQFLLKRMVSILIFMCENRVVCLVPKRNWFRKTLEGSLDWTYPKEGLKLRICHFLGQNSIFCWNTKQSLKTHWKCNSCCCNHWFSANIPNILRLTLEGFKPNVFMLPTVIVWNYVVPSFKDVPPISRFKDKGGSSWLVNYVSQPLCSIKWCDKHCIPVSGPNPVFPNTTHNSHFLVSFIMFYQQQPQSFRAVNMSWYIRMSCLNMG